MTETPRQAARRLAGEAIHGNWKPETLHTYTNAAGEPIYWRIRARLEAGGKWIRPMRLNGRGYELGEPEFQGNKPLYQLHELTARPHDPVWFVEGESCADSLARIGLLATTAGGAQSDDRADFGPLARRTVTVWPDNDQSGIDHAGRVASQLEGLKCTVSTLDAAALGLPAKGDCVDWLAAHPNATAADLAKLPRVRVPDATRGTVVLDPEAHKWSEAMDEAAFHGIAGDFVRMIEPNTEADAAAILVQFHAAFGAFVGRGPHYRVEGDEHHANLYTLLVGATAKGRKGTSWGRVRAVFEQIPGWKPHVSGLSSGEGIKYHVRDSSEKRDKHGEPAIDPGVIDKRLLVVEPEFASVLRATQRQGNTLSQTIREGWDSGNLRTLTKNDPITATGAHICIVGHITSDELRAELTATDSANGFANRFLYVAVKRSKTLPFGGSDADGEVLRTTADQLRELAEIARRRTRIELAADARPVWERVYPELSAGGDGLHGAVTARAEAQVIRLSLVYCLLDGAVQISVQHLLAGLAVWQYCDATAKHIFGASLGDRTADEIARRLQRAGADGLTRTEIRDLFGRNLSADRIGAALDLLRRKGRAACETINTGGGRPTEVWRPS